MGRQSGPARSRRLRGKDGHGPPATATAVLLLALLATVIFVVSSSSGSRPVVTTGPIVEVTSGTEATLVQHSANLVLGGSVQVGGRRIPIQGTGAVNFTAQTFALTMSADVDGGSTEEHELIVDHTLYLGASVDNINAIAKAAPGKQWAELPVPVGATGNGLLGTWTADPLSQLRMATKSDSSVRSLGSSEIDGTPSTGFTVVPSRLTVEQAIRRQLRPDGQPVSDLQRIPPAGKSLSAFTFDLWFDSSHVLRRLEMRISSTGVSGDVIMTFQDYGSPVMITAPNPESVIPLAQFLKLGSSSATT